MSIINLGRERFERAQDSANVSPRDVLVALLDRIDKGEIIPQSLIVVYRECFSNKTSSISYGYSGPSRTDLLGLLSRAAYLGNIEE